VKKDVRQAYNQLAQRYDQRWASYTSRTVAATLARLERLTFRTVLDVGCGTGALLEAVHQQHPAATLTGVDVSERMLAIAHRKLGGVVRLICGKAESLPLQSGAFDLVVSNSSLHFWENPLAGLREIRRVLAPAGHLVLTDWCDDYLTCKLCDQVLRLVDAGHQRCLSTRECRHYLDESQLRALRVEKYKLTWLWGLMTVTASKQTA
jgi:ubiquinone/menaquinone biosynthesis C-methylase UbiE